MIQTPESLIVEDAVLTYGKGEFATPALRGVSLTAKPGEVLLIRGPSGSGKTTLLQLMGAMKEPDKGKVSICGTPTTGLSQKRLRAMRLNRIGFVFQFFNLLSSLRAWENIAAPLDIIGMDRGAAEKRAKALLAEFGLADRADHFPKQLSGGQRQRLAVARAIAHDPPVILADEPTAALDTENGQAVAQILRDLAVKEGRIVVLVSHDHRLEPMVDREITIEDGRVVEERGPARPKSNALRSTLSALIEARRAASGDGRGGSGARQEGPRISSLS
ncbi:putative ABC transport system ATP-binding protein [Fulvimarina manganoxydans]|uniref:Putative ABC transport system ATP-binding protein n=1 Tax=Fulvimarina manganoxydans TaxID=937218 RepID=A0A1W2DIA4_9HYPH|nr:ABC transporter ATP-binding protein [Fulvimarina manganoxydans]SMC96696.1 putative ABC transport system ATP-binding protein [Fulvimarina manganoxydans]